MEEKELITKEQMIELFKETLAVDRVEEEDDFFVKGGNSINASLLLYKIFVFTNVSLSLMDVIEHRTPLKLAALVNTRRDKINSVSFTSNDGVFLAPYPQRHIWLSEKMDSAGANYIVTFKIPIKSEKEIDYKKIERSVFDTFENNTVYTVNIKLDKNEIKAFKSKMGIVIVNVLDEEFFSDDEVEEIVKKTILNIEDGIKGKVIIKLNEILFLLHHIVVDQASIPLLWNEIIERYYDIHNESCFNYFSCFERNDELSEHYAEGLKFWKKEYEDFSFSSPKVNGYSDKEYDRHSILLPKKEIDGVTEKSKIAYLLLLFYLSLQECNLQNSDEFVIGIPYTNRTNAIQAGTQGFFVNMMPARLKLIGMSFEAQIKYLLDYLEKMSMYQDIPYEDIINGISFNDYKEKKEFLRFAFVYQSEMSLRSFDEGESIKMKEYHLGIPMFDMTIYINDTENFYEVMLETNNMINNETINFFLERFTSLYNNLSETQNLMLVDETINSI